MEANGARWPSRSSKPVAALFEGGLGSTPRRFRQSRPRLDWRLRLVVSQTGRATRRVRVGTTPERVPPTRHGSTGGCAWSSVRPDAPHGASESERLPNAFRPHATARLAAAPGRQSDRTRRTARPSRNDSRTLSAHTPRLDWRLRLVVSQTGRAARRARVGTTPERFPPTRHGSTGGCAWSSVRPDAPHGAPESERLADASQTGVALRARLRRIDSRTLKRIA